jgi:hypothetical protein
MAGVSERGMNAEDAAPLVEPPKAPSMATPRCTLALQGRDHLQMGFDSVAAQRYNHWEHLAERDCSRP